MESIIKEIGLERNYELQMHLGEVYGDAQNYRKGLAILNQLQKTCEYPDRSIQDSINTLHMAQRLLKGRL